jgi:hypothetical protein
MAKKFKRFGAEVDVVSYVAQNENISDVPTVLVEAAVKQDLVVHHGSGKWGVRPNGRKLLMQRVEADMRAVSKLMKLKYY